MNANLKSSLEGNFFLSYLNVNDIGFSNKAHKIKQSSIKSADVWQRIEKCGNREDWVGLLLSFSMILFTKLSVNSPKTEPLLSGQPLAATYPFPESGCFKKSSLVSGFNSIDLICRNKTESPCSYWFTPAQLGRQQESCCRQTDYPRGPDSRCWPN